MTPSVFKLSALISQIPRICLWLAIMFYGTSLVPVHADTTVIAVGDIAQCPHDYTASMANQTAKLVPENASVLLLGDTTYPKLDANTFAKCFKPTWGKFLARTLAIPGNHDVVDGNANYFLQIFNRPEGRQTYFRAALGEDAWVIGLDSNLKDEAAAAQLNWLEHELNTIKDDRCLIAMWHHATLSTGLHKGDGDKLKPAWTLLNEARADIVLSGHEHFYESFDPKNADGMTVAEGIREFVVGTGGASMVDIGIGTGQRLLMRRFGVLKLVIHNHKISWSFETIDGKIFDPGQLTCRRSQKP